MRGGLPVRPLKQSVQPQRGRHITRRRQRPPAPVRNSRFSFIQLLSKLTQHVCIFMRTPAFVGRRGSAFD